MDIEDRIFELTGVEFDGIKVIDRVVDEYGVDRETVRRLYLKVRMERVSPFHARTTAAIERLSKVNFI